MLITKIIGKSDNPSHIFSCPDMPSHAHWYPKKGSATFIYPLVPISRDPAPNAYEAAPSPKINILDNTVGLVPKISGYVFNMLQTNSAAHVPNTNMNLINKDTHIYDLDLYETIFQNWCIIDKITSMTPDTPNISVASPNADTSSAAFHLLDNCRDNPKSYNITGSDLREPPVVEIGPPVFAYFTGSTGRLLLFDSYSYD